MKKNVLVGVAWPYVNGALHVGHVAGYLLPADITSRAFRLMGHKVLMVSGSDCFGTPITVEADKRGISPEEVVKIYHPKNQELFYDLLLSFDLYTLTNTDNHKKITQDFLIKFYEEGLLSVKSTPQYYSPSQNKFLPDRYVEGVCPFCGFLEARSDQCDNCGNLLSENLKNPVSKLDKRPVELKETEHIFIEWGKLQERIEKYFDEKSDKWREWVRKETKKWLEKGLSARAVTRDLDWGVEIPNEIPLLHSNENKRIYVWFDAVIGYFSASVEWAETNHKNWEDFWKGDPLHYYFMGKDNLVFHTIFWPGQILTYDRDFHTPDFPAINQYLNLDGAKFSKSRGVTIDTREFIDRFGPEPLRFYLTTIMPEEADANFVWEDFYQKNNDLLVGHIGNYINRTLSLFKDTKPESKYLTPKTLEKIDDAKSKSIDFIQKSQFKNYLSAILDLCHFANVFFNEKTPWITKKENNSKFAADGSDLLALTYAIMSLMSPITPKASEQYSKMVNFPVESFWGDGETKIILKEFLEKIEIGTVVPLYKKFEKEL